MTAYLKKIIKYAYFTQKWPIDTITYIFLIFTNLKIDLLAEIVKNRLKYQEWSGSTDNGEGLTGKRCIQDSADSTSHKSLHCSLKYIDTMSRIE